MKERRERWIIEVQICSSPVGLSKISNSILDTSIHPPPHTLTHSFAEKDLPSWPILPLHHQWRRAAVRKIGCHILRGEDRQFERTNCRQLGRAASKNLRRSYIEISRKNINIHLRERLDLPKVNFLKLDNQGSEIIFGSGKTES